MSRKDYELIARVLRDANVADEHQYELLERIALGFALELAATNPRFDRECFLAACGVER
jgi:hypothetical protein